MMNEEKHDKRDSFFKKKLVKMTVYYGENQPQLYSH